jgi:ankyrin repeat protein
MDGLIDWNSSNHKNIPLHNAVRAGREDVVRLLLKSKADPTLRNANGNTPLDEAKLIGVTSIMQVLSQSSAFTSGT